MFKFFGPRIIKTGIAITLSLYITDLIGLDTAFFAGIAAFISLQPSVAEGVKKGYDRIIGTILGGLIAMSILFVLPVGLLTTGFTIILTISLLAKFNLHDAIPISTVMLLIILADVGGDLVHYTLVRIAATAIGVIVATLVNVLIMAPVHNKLFLQRLMELNTHLSNSFSEIDCITGECKLQLDKDLTNVSSELGILETEAQFKIWGKKGKQNFLYTYKEYIFLYSHIVARLEEIRENLTIHQKDQTVNPKVEDFYTKLISVCGNIGSLLNGISFESKIDNSKNIADFKENRGSLRKYLHELLSGETLPFETQLELSHLLFLVEEIKEYLSKLLKLVYTDLT